VKEKKRGLYKLLSRKKIYQNPWLAVREDRVLRPGGDQGVFGVVEMQAGSTILAINDKNEAYVAKEYKYAIDRNSVELISGGINKGESPLAAAKRELKEEAGLRAARWISLGVVDPFTTIVKSPNYMFLALDVTEGVRCLDKGEILKVIKVPLVKVVDMVIKSRITHSASCVCVLKAKEYLAGKRSNVA
jgi:8-oxo-dGTP pyrophosphatase MutT (NUDIX family)